ncbi:MAG: WD40 repeat domain-containing protein, partial [Promethearchaeia archaeon]
MSNVAQHAAPDETADHVAPRSKATTPAVQLERVVEVTCDPADLPVHQHVDRRMLGHGAGVLSLAGGREHEELLLSGSKDCTCRLWDLEAGQCVRTIVAHSDAVRSAKFSLDDRLVFTAGDHCVRVWDRLSPREVACFKGHHGHVTDVDVQMRQLGSISYGLTMVSASFDCTLRVWDLRAQLAIRSCVGHSKPVTSCALMPDGKTVVSGGLDAVARFFDAAAITANVPYSLTNPMTQARQHSLCL